MTAKEKAQEIAEDDKKIKGLLVELLKLLGEDVSIYGTVNTWFQAHPKTIIEMLEWRIKDIQNRNFQA